MLAILKLLHKRKLTKGYKDILAMSKQNKKKHFNFDLWLRVVLIAWNQCQATFQNSQKFLKDIFWKVILHKNMNAWNNYICKKLTSSTIYEKFEKIYL